MAYDYSKLRGRIVEKYGNQYSFSDAMGLSERSLSLKLNGKRPWKQFEISKAINLLGLTEKDIQSYFFSKKVQGIELYIRR